MFEGSK